MRMTVFALITMVALSMCSAQAGNFNGGVLAMEGDFAVLSVPSKNYYDEFFNFQINKISSLKATAIVNNFDAANLVGNEVDLYNDDTGMDYRYFTFGTTKTSAFFNNLAAGNYFYEVSGFNDGAQAGRVSFSSTFISAVPEPETYAMLLAGLGLMGFVSRRHKSRGQV